MPFTIVCIQCKTVLTETENFRKFVDLLDKVKYYCPKCDRKIKNHKEDREIIVS